MVVDKRIPVSKERWEKLGKMKKAGQTYDDLLEELIQKAKKVELAEQMDEVKEMDEDELIDVEEL
ncbi:MAG: hypothetical protein ACQEP7_06105 [bacterium]